MKSTILFRTDTSTNDELISIQNHFPGQFTLNRASCKDSLVIGRYSVLPYYRELETDLAINGCKLINSYSQHKWIAEFQYYEDLQEFTFQTWPIEELPYIKYEGPFVVKGKTNSRKFNWKTLMFAENKQAATKIALELFQDPLISKQGIIARKYEKLKTLEIGVNGLPFTNEWRFFILDSQVVACGYYWSIAETLPEAVSDGARALVDKVVGVVGDKANFYVIDVAEKENGDWVMIELNDGQMSGLCTIEPDDFYRSLKEILEVMDDRENFQRYDKKEIT